MGLSRRTFTREFKLSAIRRLEMGVPIAELARAIESTPIPCIVGKESSWRVRATCFPGRGKRAGRRGGLRSWSARWDGKLWRLIF